MAKQIFHRNCRLFSTGGYSEGGKLRYISDLNYAQSPEQYVRAFLLIQKDFQTLFEYVEPADINLSTYSYRIHELLMRACIEVEANFKAILSENLYSKKEEKWNIKDYEQINKTHKLSCYEVKLPVWHGSMSTIKPFNCWGKNQNLSWYNAYNETKHNRHNKFQQANFESLINAVCGLLVLLSSQFYTEDFSSGSYYLVSESRNNLETAIGSYFRIKFPQRQDWNDTETYDFTAKEICDGQYQIVKLDYNNI